MFDLARLPRPDSRRLAIRVTAAAERELRQGHPWLFDGGVTSVSFAGQPGDLGVVFDGERRFLAIGLYDPTSPIRLRVLQHREPAPIDAAWFRGRLLAAAGRRAALQADESVTGLRLVHGENDGLPGLVVDVYATVQVLRLDTAAWVPHLTTLVPLLVELWRPAGIVLRLSRRAAAQPEFLAGLTDGQLLHGTLPEPPLLFRENGFLMEVDPVAGQKTGYFLDQRDNRAYVETLAAGRDLLDVFAYHGGFALHAARGGARALVTIDQSQPATATALRNFKRNENLTGRPAADYETLVGDAFQTMALLARHGRRFDLIVLDPPSFARRQADVPGALVAYRRLVLAGLGLLAPAGILVAASCSSRVAAEPFFALVQETVREAGRPGQVLRTSQHAIDHPIGFPEGAYLKCIALRS
ncbi:MAG: class I SAM-dependent methyltransferase [Anaerolineales bacterium]|nr:class I SAM-dependent methyltransferase [Anaerolineales bacterium]MCB0031043.1 class I SAM-dependent methyltransferase [Anaerolineales bacterium]MCB8963323.1 class I SAM-dependent methyltransferase [Ardenticatenales bacterium]